MKPGNALLLLIILLIAGVTTCHGKDFRLTKNDKAQIIKSILFKADFLKRGLRVGEERDFVYLSTENVSPELVPKLPGVRIILIDEVEIAKKLENGFGHYAFGEFVVKGSKVLVSFAAKWSNSHFGSSSYQITHYEYRRKSGKWRGRIASVSLGRS
jgi:hypothetical protein